MKTGSLTALAYALFLWSCGTKEDATISVYAQELTVTHGKNAFGDKAEGSVKVIFELGHYSGAAMRVEGISLSLYRDGKAMPSVTPVVRFSPDTGEPTLPLDLASGQTKSIKYKISGSSPTEPLALTADQAKELCAGPVMVNGTAQITGQIAPMSIAAAPVAVTGCP